MTNKKAQQKQVKQQIDHKKYVYVKPVFPIQWCVAMCATCTLSVPSSKYCLDCEFSEAFTAGYLISGTIALYQSGAGAEEIQAFWDKFPPYTWNMVMDSHLMDDYFVTVVHCVPA